MKHIFTLFAFALMSSASAQTVLPPNYPYNPDSDGDEFVAVSDVLMSVASYDNGFQAQSIMVDTLSLEEAIEILLQRQAQNQQELIQGISSALSDVEGFDPCPLQWSCGCPLTYQGYEYATVQIGEQCWFAENLRSETYANGDAITTNLGNDEWASTLEGAMSVYGEAVDDSCLTSAENLDSCNPLETLAAWGRLYNAYAVEDSRGLCPVGWQVPSDEVWLSLEMTLGMSEEVANTFGFRGSDQGLQLKANSGWNNNGSGANTTGFSGVPGGGRYDGEWIWGGHNGSFWTSTSVASTQARTRGLDSEMNGIYRGNTPKHFGVSIRCIQDSE